MPRLFWRFFSVIWMTMAATIATMIVVINLLREVPFARQLDNERREVALNLIADVLARDGEDAAMRLVRIGAETLPPGMTLSKSMPAVPCASVDTVNDRSVARDGVCYRLSLPVRPISAFDLAVPFIPWAAILFSSTIAAAALARYVIRPVVHLRDGLSALAHGRFDIRIGDRMAGRKDEVTALAHDFDATAARLQELQDAQQRLFHDVSHELRSPLSRLQVVAGVLRQSPSKLDAMLDRIDREAERLDALVGEVLTLARLTVSSGPFLKPQTLDVVDLLNEILSDAAFEARTRNVSITPSVDGVFLAEVDGELIYRALENVIRNAVKYTAEGSPIVVRCEITAELLKVWVMDRGPGVGRDELERIFQPFARGSRTTVPGGFGLGLAITRQTLERHGGRVYARLPDDGGLEITLEIPRGGAARR